MPSVINAREVHRLIFYGFYYKAKSLSLYVLRRNEKHIQCIKFVYMDAQSLNLVFCFEKLKNNR